MSYLALLKGPLQQFLGLASCLPAWASWNAKLKTLREQLFLNQIHFSYIFEYLLELLCHNQQNCQNICSCTANWGLSQTLSRLYIGSSSIPLINHATFIMACWSYPDKCWDSQTRIFLYTFTIEMFRPWTHLNGLSEPSQTFRGLWETHKNYKD